MTEQDLRDQLVPHLGPSGRAALDRGLRTRQDIANVASASDEDAIMCAITPEDKSTIKTITNRAIRELGKKE